MEIKITIWISGMIVSYIIGRYLERKECIKDKEKYTWYNVVTIMIYSIVLSWLGAFLLTIVLLELREKEPPKWL